MNTRAASRASSRPAAQLLEKGKELLGFLRADSGLLAAENSHELMRCWENVHRLHQAEAHVQLPALPRGDALAGLLLPHRQARYRQQRLACVLQLRVRSRHRRVEDDQAAGEVSRWERERLIVMCSAACSGPLRVASIRRTRPSPGSGVSDERSRQRRHSDGCRRRD